MTVTEVQHRIESIRAAFPREGLFAEKEWLLTPEPFPLPAETVAVLERLGPVLQRFLIACNLFYRRSFRGSLPTWIAGYLDAGKPDDIIALGRASDHLDVIPRVLRPDLILTEDGLALTEIDNLPGGIGLTAWLNETYSQWDTEGRIIGGAEGMLDGFRGIMPRGGHVLVSEESGDYRPEMAWLTRRLSTLFGKEGTWHTLRAEDYPFRDREVYRFFELFDLRNIPGSSKLARHAAAGAMSVSPPFKAFLEEKLWLALFHMAPLRAAWIRELRESNVRFLDGIIPYGWVMDPTPLPQHAVLPRLGIHGWDDLKLFTQSQRQLVLKRSGFSDQAWGSRSVKIGSDLSHLEWKTAIDDALAGFPKAPYIMQIFRKGKLVEHPFWDPAANKLRNLKARVRLCPYYFSDAHGEAKLRGVLATICPADKKVLHGMSDAILAPCSVF